MGVDRYLDYNNGEIRINLGRAYYFNVLSEVEINDLFLDLNFIHLLKFKIFL